MMVMNGPISILVALKRLPAMALAMLLVLAACGQSASDRTAVKLSATVSEAPPAITLQWQPISNSTSFTIYRKSTTASSWGSAVANLGGTATQWTDAGVTPGLTYDYKVVRSASGTGYGYIRSGIRVAAQEDRGTLVLLVAEDLASQLSLEIAQLEEDLLSDGWWVIRHDIPLAASTASVRQQLISDRMEDPDVNTVYILGHVPVPYSGNINPDGHTEHRGAWACDAFYGEMNSTWTDATLNSAASAFPWNINVPGDGKYDQNDLPSAVELMVGRVDLSNLPSFSLTSSQLMWNYLNKAHRWKRKELTVPATAVLFDDLQWTGYPLSQSGHMALSACVGPTAVTEVPASAGPFIDQLTAGPRLWTYHCSTGAQSTGTQGQITFVGTQSGANTQQVANASAQGIFNMSFGSYYGDWDNEDNYLRALLGSGNALAHVWSSIPNWYMYPMAMGETIGHCARLSQNNTQQVHSPQNAGWQGQSVARIHMSLMGDPTLRQVQVAPPADLSVTREGWFAAFSWTASPEPVAGYVIHRIDTVNGAFVRVNPELLSGTSYTSNTVFFPGDRYVVRAVQAITGNTGSFFALSLGAMARAEGIAVADCAGILGGTAVPGSACDDGDPLTVNDVLDTKCQCAGELGTGIGALEKGPGFVLERTVGGITIRAGRDVDADYQLLSAQGSTLRTGRMRGDRLSIDTGTLAAGTYLWVLAPHAAAPAGVTRRFVVDEGH
jgi:hypothetical protein